MNDESFNGDDVAADESDWSQETPEAKARWFRSLTVEQRMEYLCWVVDLAQSQHPNIGRNRLPTGEGVRILELPGK